MNTRDIPFSQVAISGGAGFIGSNLARTLLQAGLTVTVLDNFFSGKRRNLDFVVEEGYQSRFRLVEGDIRDPKALDEAFAGAERVFHMAALGSVPLSVKEPLLAHDINVNGSLAVYEAARRHKIPRVVVSSTSALYGNNPVLPKDEDLRPEPESPYASAKLAMESYGADYTRYFGVEVAILRYFNVFGPHQDPHSIYAAVIPIFVYKLLSGEAPIIFGDGEQTRDFIHVYDVARANILAAGAPSALMGRPINIAGGERISVNLLFDEIQKLLGSPLRPIYAPARLGDVVHSVASVVRAREGLGFTPEISVPDGLARSIEWYKADYLAQKSAARST